MRSSANFGLVPLGPHEGEEIDLGPLLWLLVLHLNGLLGFLLFDVPFLEDPFLPVDLFHDGTNEAIRVVSILQFFRELLFAGQV